MSLTVLTIGDLHIKSSNIPETDILRKRLLKIARKVNPDLIVVMGDTLNNFNSITSQPLVTAVELLNNLSEISRVILLIGNHDIPGNSLFMSDLHPFTALKYHPKIKVIDQQCYIEEIKGIKFACVPYAPNGMFIDALSTNEDFDLDDINVIFAHQQFSGCLNPNYSDQGDGWDPTWPLVISGHIHQYEKIRNNIIYIGTPRQTDFGDTDLNKTVSKFIFNKDDDFKFEEERIKVGVPPKVTFKVKCSRIKKWDIPKSITVIKGNIRIELIGTSIEIVSIKAHPKIKSWIDKGVVIKYNTIADSNNSEDEIDIQSRINEIVSDRQTVSFQSELIERLKHNSRWIDLYEKELTF